MLGFAVGCASEGPNVGVTVDDVTGNASEYMGQNVTVSGEVDEVYPGAFTIGGEGFGDELLVIVPSTAQTPGGRTGPMAYQEDDIVQVDGTVRAYVIAEIERDFGLDLGAGAEIDYEEEAPALIASAVRVTQREDPLVEDPVMDQDGGL